jgi:hypothetical protein
MRTLIFPIICSLTYFLHPNSILFIEVEAENPTASLEPVPVDELNTIMLLCAPVLLFLCIAETAYALVPVFVDLNPGTMGTVLVVVLICWICATIAALTMATTLFASRKDYREQLWRIMKIMLTYIFVVGYISGSSMALTVDVNDFHGSPEIGRHILLSAMLVEITILAVTAIMTRCVVTAFVGCCIIAIGLTFFCTVVAIAFLFAGYGSVLLTRRVLVVSLLIEVLLFGLFLYRRYSTPQPPPAEATRPVVQPRIQGEYVALPDDIFALPVSVEESHTPRISRPGNRFDVVAFFR